MNIYLICDYLALVVKKALYSAVPLVWNFGNLEIVEYHYTLAQVIYLCL